MNDIHAEKLEQAESVLNEFDVDAWLLFVRESSHVGDPALNLIHSGSFTWPTALLLTRNGDRIAIVGKYDDGPLRDSNLWTEIIPYIEGIRDPLREILNRVAPQSLALNYSLDDFSSDGLSHGMFLLLSEIMGDLPCSGRHQSSTNVVAALRSRKTAGEIKRIQEAIRTTETLFGEVERFAKIGMTEKQIASFLQGRVNDLGLETAWESPCPIVNAGPASQIGHASPSDIQLEAGHVLHIDFGVRQAGYCSDIQRCWYVPHEHETAPPEPVNRAFCTVRDAIQLAFDFAASGKLGWEVDKIARDHVIAQGYDEYGHALGHHVGQNAHDGGGVLGPRWERYGKSPTFPLEAGNVVTIEPSIEKAGGCGGIGLEEMAVVETNGCRWLSPPQSQLPMLGRESLYDQ